MKYNVGDIITIAEYPSEEVEDNPGFVPQMNGMQGQSFEVIFIHDDHGWYEVEYRGGTYWVVEEWIESGGKKEPLGSLKELI